MSAPIALADLHGSFTFHLKYVTCTPLYLRCLVTPSLLPHARVIGRASYLATPHSRGARGTMRSTNTDQTKRERNRNRNRSSHTHTHTHTHTTKKKPVCDRARNRNRSRTQTRLLRVSEAKARETPPPPPVRYRYHTLPPHEARHTTATPDPNPTRYLSRRHLFFNNTPPPPPVSHHCQPRIATARPLSRSNCHHRHLAID